MKRISKPNSSHILLVEGEADRGFLEQVCKKLNLNPEIKIATPKDFQADYDNPLPNGKQNVLNLLNDLLPDLIDESPDIKRLAAIIDADYDIKNGLGFQKTLNRIKEIATDYDFNLLENNNNGLIFKNGDLEFGLWIMPNNQQEGMLEDFIRTCITSDEQELFNKAAETIQTISAPKFDKTIHLTKAEIATWLAWQKTPGHGFYVSVKDNLLQTDHALFQELEKWLKHIFI
jgi:hypothetical protein